MVRRILIADDSALFRTLLRNIFSRDPALAVVGEAKNGQEAIDQARRLKPDLITMDLNMPVLGGLEATRRIMETDARAIVAVTGTVDRKDVKEAFHAIEAGALALVAKPPSPGDPDFDSAVSELITTVKLMSEVKVVGRRSRRPKISAPVRSLRTQGTPGEIVAIASSTGGPAALESIVRKIPADFPAPIVVVQHIASGFEQGLVDWLQKATDLNVKLACHHLRLRPGEIVVACTGRHLEVGRESVRLTGGKAVDGHCPSASVFFSSVAASWGPKAVAVILTGMGRDGARGLIELKAAGGRVIAQDEDSSVVYGMPAAAVQAGATDAVLPLEAIPAALLEICAPRPARSR